MLLLDGYLPTLALTLGYLLVVWMGPRYMKHRQSYSCRGAMMLYNLGITILSFGMFSEVKGPGVNKKWLIEGIYRQQPARLASKACGSYVASMGEKYLDSTSLC